jgi:hypothetical protein
MPKVELSSKERSKLQAALTKIGSEYAQNVSGGEVFRTTFVGTVTVSVAAGGSTLKEAFQRLNGAGGAMELQTHSVLTKESLIVLNQADHYGVVTGTLGEFEYIGQVPGDETTYGVVQRMKLGYLMASFFSTDGPSTPVLKAMKVCYDALVGMSKENPVDVGTQSALRRRMSTIGVENIREQPWFVGKASSAQVESGLENGMVGDFVVRESASTVGAYVLCTKLSPTEFIQQKITKNGGGSYQIDGKRDVFATLGKLIESDPKARRPAANTVLGRTSKGAGKETEIGDVRTDIKAFDALYLGSQHVFDKRVQSEVTPAVGKEVVKRCVVENSDSRRKLKLKAKQAVPYEVVRETTRYGTVMDENPVALVLTPKHVRIVERISGETLTTTFIRGIPFTLEAPGRQGGFDKFAFITKNEEVGQVDCHIFNVLPGDGHLLAEAISFYIELAEQTYGADSVAKHNPFEAKGPRQKSSKRLFARQIHRADLKAVKVIGAGQFGEVWLADQAIRKANGQVVQARRAIKMLKEGGSDADRDEFILESETMLEFDHDNVVRIVGVAVQQMPWLAVLEFMKYGDLKGLVKTAGQKGVKLLTAEVLDIAHQSACGCGYINSLRLAHMDIAARNILFGENNRIKLADFGLTRPFDQGTNSYRLKERLTLSIKWTAVEALKKKMFNEKSDVWSFGIVVWEMLSYGELPYKMVPINQMNSFLEKGSRLKQPEACPPDVWAMIMQCWSADVDVRFDFARAQAAIRKLQEKYPLPGSRRDLGKTIKEKVVDRPDID